MIYFDNAATTGHKPPGVIRSVNYSLNNLCANPGRSGHQLSQKAALEIFKVRKKVSDYFGGDGEENVIFTQNCTTSINFVLKGLLSNGDHIVISDMEHNAVMRPIKNMNVEFSTAEVSFYNEQETIENFKRAIKPNTKLIFCTAASNVFGKTLPIKEIGDLCRQRGVLFGVDAAQTAGVIPIDMKAMNIDYLCIAPHKGLYCPMGVGILIARSPIKRTIIEGGTGTDSISQIQPNILPEMFESGTVNLPAIVSIGAGIDFVRGLGNRIIEYENKLIKRFYYGLTDSKVRFYTNPTDSGYVPVISFNIADIHSEKIAGILSEKGFALRAGLHCAPMAHRKIGTLNQGTVRFSPSVFNSFQEVNSLIKEIKKI